MSDAALKRARALRLAGAVAVLIGGAIHLYLAFDDYGTGDLQQLFFVNALVSGAAGAYVALRRDDPVGPLAALGVTVASLAAFAVSRVGDGVVGFTATGLDPSPEAILILIVEGLALVLLTGLLLTERNLPRPDLSLLRRKR